MAVDLRSLITQGFAAPALDQIQLEQHRQDITQELGITTEQIQRQLGTRTLPDIGEDFAARGSFGSGGRLLTQARAREDATTQAQTAQRHASVAIRDLVTMMGLLPFGRTL